MALELDIHSLEIEKMLTRSKLDIIGESELNKIRIEDCVEPLEKIAIDRVIITMTEDRQRFSDEELYARTSVVKQLSKVSKQVYPLRLKVFDAFRPVEYQQKRYDEIYGKIKNMNPEFDEDQLRNETFVYVFPPSYHPQTPSPHCTGAALDLTLTYENGEELDMGTNYGEFDNPLVCTNAIGLGKEQRDNRNLLITSMAKFGFVSYPGEWWHFSLGDREWVAYLGRINLPSVYGRASDPYKG